MNTRRYPRTLEQAFGPYARGPIQDPQDPMPREDRLIVWIGIAGAVATAGLLFLGWI